MSEERVEAYAKLLNTLISAVRQEERALSQEAEAERDALREQVRVLKGQIYHLTHHAGMCPFCETDNGHKLDCIGVGRCPSCEAAAIKQEGQSCEPSPALPARSISI